MSAVP
ncbi:uncharacterized protein FRV6_16969 [Fusarium oxysporum]